MLEQYSAVRLFRKNTLYKLECPVNRIVTATNSVLVVAPSLSPLKA